MNKNNKKLSITKSKNIITNFNNNNNNNNKKNNNYLLLAKSLDYGRLKE
jgi:hypothetical protein